MLDDVVEGSHKLHQVMAGHGGGDREDAEHGAAPDVLLQGGHLAAKGTVTRPHVTPGGAKAQLLPPLPQLQLLGQFFCHPERSFACL